MFHSPVKCLLIALFIFWGVHVSAQTTTSSGTNTSNPLTGRENNPYSKYGIGELVNGNGAVLRGMGNVTSAYENPYQINSDNPASYAFLQRTTFELGGTASTRNVSGSGLSYQTGTATISYLNLGIPLTKKSGLCLGFKPYSRSYYNMVDTVTNPVSPIGQVIRSYNGEGGLNNAFIGAAYNFHGLSIGFNFGYLFGTLHNASATVPIDSALINRAYATEYTNYTSIGGVYWKGGVMYEHKLDSDYTFHIGGTFTLKQSLHEHLNAYQISTYNFGDTLVNDTSSNPGEQYGKLKMPLSYSIGVLLSKNDKWAIGIDYTATNWSSFSSTPDATLTSGVGSTAYRISLGGEITPDANNIRSYTRRVTYRMGFYYGSDYLNLATATSSSSTLPYYGLTLGASLPFKRSLSHLNAALDIGRLGTTALITETYVRFTLGISINDRWFIPRKYD